MVLRHRLHHARGSYAVARLDLLERALFGRLGFGELAALTPALAHRERAAVLALEPFEFTYRKVQPMHLEPPEQGVLECEVAEDGTLRKCRKLQIRVDGQDYRGNP